VSERWSFPFISTNYNWPLLWSGDAEKRAAKAVESAIEELSGPDFLVSVIVERDGRINALPEQSFEYNPVTKYLTVADENEPLRFHGRIPYSCTLQSPEGKLHVRVYRKTRNQQNSREWAPSGYVEVIGP
jgi:hypothetical protein